MSWSSHHPDVSADELRASERPESAPEDQFSAAVEAALVIIETGSVGDPLARRFSVTLAGHSNPGHEPAEGWANDAASVSVYQLPDAES